jgi:hypothetical protein
LIRDKRTKERTKKERYPLKEEHFGLLVDDLQDGRDLFGDLLQFLLRLRDFLLLLRRVTNNKNNN